MKRTSNPGSSEQLAALAAQLDACLERLQRIEEDVTGRAREREQLERQCEEQRARLARAEESVAERDQRIAQLTGRIQALEAQIASAGAESTRLQTVLAAEQAARQDRQNAKAAAYRELIQGLVSAVDEAVPADATVLVASKGDDRLLALNSRRAWHFPQTAEGAYAGHHPADSRAAIGYLEALREKGGQYFVLPATSLWWLDHYAEFKEHLETRHRRVWERDQVGVIFALSHDALSHDVAAASDDAACTALAEVFESLERRLDRRPAILDWASGLDLATHFGQYTVFSPPAANGRLPYLDGTIDVVVAGSATDAKEARRAASGVVVVVGPEASGDEAVISATPRFDITWITRAAPSGLDASIIIPCYNALELTEACLKAVTASLPRDFGGEIIVFDDGSTDGTRERLKQWKRDDARIRVLGSRSNGGFVTACNRAARAATRDYLVFLNNDTEPCAGWLPALLDTFRRFPAAGAAGGKLVLPDGTLQEAGGVIFQDGSAANFMRGERNLEAPLVNYVREVDYCSGALLATPRRLFEKLNGFDRRYRPAYYEDVDYCFRVRQRGQRVYYQPASVVVHREGGTCGTDLARGVKRHQVRNRQTFVARWQPMLQRQPVRPEDHDRAAWRRLAERTRVDSRHPAREAR